MFIVVRIDVRTGMCISMRADMHTDMCIDMYIDMRIGMCIDVYIDMCTSVCRMAHLTRRRTRRFPRAHATVSSHYKTHAIATTERHLCCTTLVLGNAYVI